MSNGEKKTIEANFLQFIGGMAVQTLVHLGQMANPMTGEKKSDLLNAKYSIDILAILQEKTKGNLTPEENEYLQNILRDLRMQYVSVAGADKAGAGEQPPNPPPAAGAADEKKS